MNLTIVPAAAADAAELLAFLQQVGSETDNLSFGAEGLPFSVEAEAAYLARIADSCDERMLVAKVDGRIIGNASLSRLPRRMSHRGEISIAVVRAQWGNGVGRSLLHELLAFAREHAFDQIDLQVRSDNLRAIRLYEDCGFQKLCTYPGFFKLNDQPIDFDFMCLRLR